MRKERILKLKIHNIGIIYYSRRDRHEFSEKSFLEQKGVKRNARQF